MIPVTIRTSRKFYMHHQQLKEQLTISVHQSDSHRFRFGARLSDSVDVLCPDTKLVLPIWEEVLETNRHFTTLKTVLEQFLSRAAREHSPVRCRRCYCRTPGVSTAAPRSPRSPVYRTARRYLHHRSARTTTASGRTDGCLRPQEPLLGGRVYLRRGGDR